MVLIHFTAEEFLQLGLRLVGFGGLRVQRMAPSVKLTRFRSSFGTRPHICSAIFDDFQTTAIAEARIDSPCYSYFLITLHWLASYPKEADMAGQFDLDEKTLRFHIRKYLRAIQAFKANKIIWQELNTVQEIIPLTVDGVHCQIPELHLEPSSKWKSFKAKFPGLSYELGISIHECKLVWVNGPFKAGTRDVDIFNKPNGLGSKIPAGKKVLANKGYPGVHDKVVLKVKDVDSPEVYDFKNRALARHETFNGRLKRYQILKERFRNRVLDQQAQANNQSKADKIMEYHKVVFEAICVLVQYEIDNGHPLFEV